MKKVTEMQEKPLSRQKILSYLKTASLRTDDFDSIHRYMYALGRSTLADNLLAGIYCGDFDAGKAEVIEGWSSKTVSIANIQNGHLTEDFTCLGGMMTMKRCIVPFFIKKYHRRTITSLTMRDADLSKQIFRWLMTNKGGLWRKRLNEPHSYMTTSRNVLPSTQRTQKTAACVGAKLTAYTSEVNDVWRLHWSRLLQKSQMPPCGWGYGCSIRTVVQTTARMENLPGGEPRCLTTTQPFLKYNHIIPQYYYKQSISTSTA